MSLFPSYWEWQSNKHTLSKCLWSMIESSERIPRNGRGRSYGGFIDCFLRTLHTDFHSGCSSLEFHQHQERIPFPTLPPASAVSCFGDFYYSEKGEMKPLSCFELHLPDCWRWWTFFWDISWPLFFHLLRTLCLGPRPIFWTGHLFFLILFFFWVLYIFWILILCQMSNWQRLSAFLWTFSPPGPVFL